jgi:hypothetical protein
VADRPEALRLFELPGPGDIPEPGHERPSRAETTAPSRHGTAERSRAAIAAPTRHEPTAPSRDETRAYASRCETREQASQAADQGSEPLSLVTEAARTLRTAHSHLLEAIATARAAGHSWRELGAASGVPYQSLHRWFQS